MTAVSPLVAGIFFDHNRLSGLMLFVVVDSILWMGLILALAGNPRAARRNTSAPAGAADTI